jgi:large subunit ribosomal protein L21
MSSKFEQLMRRINMYAIIESGGKQYTVREGQTVRLEKLAGETGDQITIGSVLAFNNDEQTVVGTPFISGALVTGKVLAQAKARKVTIFKYRRRKDSKKKRGHRQPYTALMIEKIQMEG